MKHVITWCGSDAYKHGYQIGQIVGVLGPSLAGLEGYVQIDRVPSGYKTADYNEAWLSPLEDPDENSLYTPKEREHVH